MYTSMTWKCKKWVQPQWLRKLKSVQPQWLRKLKSVQPQWLRKLKSVQPQWLRKLKSVQPQWLRKCKSVQPQWLRKCKSVQPQWLRKCKSVQPQWLRKCNNKNIRIEIMALDAQGLEIWVWWVKDLLWPANSPHTSSTILSYKRKRRMKEKNIMNSLTQRVFLLKNGLK